MEIRRASKILMCLGLYFGSFFLNVGLVWVSVFSGKWCFMTKKQKPA